MYIQDFLYKVKSNAGEIFENAKSFLTTLLNRIEQAASKKFQEIRRPIIPDIILTPKKDTPSSPEDSPATETINDCDFKHRTFNNHEELVNQAKIKLTQTENQTLELKDIVNNHRTNKNKPSVQEIIQYDKENSNELKKLTENTIYEIVAVFDAANIKLTSLQLCSMNDSDWKNSLAIPFWPLSSGINLSNRTEFLEATQSKPNPQLDETTFSVK